MWFTHISQFMVVKKSWIIWFGRIGTTQHPQNYWDSQKQKLNKHTETWGRCLIFPVNISLIIIAFRLLFYFSREIIRFSLSGRKYPIWNPYFLSMSFLRLMKNSQKDGEVLRHSRATHKHVQRWLEKGKMMCTFFVFLWWWALEKKLRSHFFIFGQQKELENKPTFMIARFRTLSLLLRKISKKFNVARKFKRWTNFLRLKNQKKTKICEKKCDSMRYYVNHIICPSPEITAWIYSLFLLSLFPFFPFPAHSSLCFAFDKINPDGPIWPNS